MTKVALHPLQILGLQVRDERRHRATEEPTTRGVAPHADLAGVRDVLVGDGESGIKKWVASRVRHHRPFPGVVGGVICIDSVTILAERRWSQVVREGAGLGPRLE